MMTYNVAPLAAPNGAKAKGVALHVRNMLNVIAINPKTPVICVHPRTYSSLLAHARKSLGILDLLTPIQLTCNGTKVTQFVKQPTEAGNVPPNEG